MNGAGFGRGASAGSNPGLGSQAEHQYWRVHRGDNERAFVSARRHSALVHILRIAIPAGVVLIAAGTTLITYLNPLLKKLPVDFGHAVVSGTKISMEKPRMSGFTRDGRPYNVTADVAVHDLTKPDMMELHNIHANMQTQSNGTVHMVASDGLYNSKVDTLKLDNSIFISSTDGYKGYLSSAIIQIRKGHVVSDRPVKLEMLQGTLDAKRMEITNSGERIYFTDGVKAMFILSNAYAASRTQDTNNDGSKNAEVTRLSGNIGPPIPTGSIKGPADHVRVRLPPVDPRPRDHKTTEPTQIAKTAIPKSPYGQHPPSDIKSKTTRGRQQQRAHDTHEPLRLYPTSQ